MRRFVLSIFVVFLLLCTGCGNDAKKDAAGAENTPAVPENTKKNGSDTALPGGEELEADFESGNDDSAGGGTESEEEAGQTPGAVSETEGEEVTSDADSEMEDHVFQIWEAPLAEGRILRLEVVGRQADEYKFGVREVRVYDGDRLLQTVLSSEGYWHEDYTECWSKEAAVEILDLNFDGNMDFGLFGWVTNNTIPFYYWTWDTEEECYRYAGTLQGAELLPETEEVVCSGRSGWGSYWADYYHPNADGELLLVRSETEDYGEIDIMESEHDGGCRIEETRVPRDGVEIRSTDEEIPEDALVLIRRQILIEEVYDDGVSYFEEIWELKDGELQMISREEVFL